MENEKPLNENKVEEQKIITGGQAENNSQKELPKEPIVLSPAPLTIETAGGVDNLYKAWLKGKKVELPPWLIEKGKDDDKRIEVDTQELFMYIKEHEYILCVSNLKGVDLYHYDKKGYYKFWTEGECKAFIKNLIPVKIRKSAHWEAVYRELITEYANTDISQLNSDEDIINFKNGILQLSTGKILPHSPEYLSTIQIDCNYIPNLPLAKAQVTIKYLNDLTSGDIDDQIALLEFLGLTISNVKCARCKKLLVLTGPGDTGKSKYRELLEKIVGEENSETITLSQMHSKFGLGGIYGKRLIGCRRLSIYKSRRN